MMKGFVQKFKKAQGANPLVVFDVKQQHRFTLRHFIEDVTYNVHNFLEKNKDTMSQDVEQLLSTSSVPLVKHLFTAASSSTDSPADRRSPSVAPNRSPAARKVCSTSPFILMTNSSQASVCIAFKNQLAALATVLSTSKCHFVRCIKPNETSQSGHFDGGKVMNQLRSTSIVQVVKLRRAGFGARYGIDTFWERYHYLMGSGPGDKVSKIKSYLKALDGTCQEWQVGRSKVFLKDFMARVLDQQRGLMLNRFVVSIQRYVRRAGAQRQLLHLRQIREQELARQRQEQMRREQEERTRREQEDRMRREQEERRRREEEERARRAQEERAKQEEQRSKVILVTTGPKKQPPSFSPYASPRSLDNTHVSTGSVSVASPRSLDNTHNSLVDTSMSSPTFRNIPGQSPRQLPIRPNHTPSFNQPKIDSPQLSPQSSPRDPPPARQNRVRHLTLRSSLF